MNWEGGPTKAVVTLFSHIRRASQTKPASRGNGTSDRGRGDTCSSDAVRSETLLHSAGLSLVIPNSQSCIADLYSSTSRQGLPLDVQRMCASFLHLTCSKCARQLSSIRAALGTFPDKLVCPACCFSRQHNCHNDLSGGKTLGILMTCINLADLFCVHAGGWLLGHSMSHLEWVQCWDRFSPPI